MIKAVVFDSDGTLLDSFEFIVGAYAYVAARFGYPVPTPDMVRAQLRMAPPLHQILHTFFPDEDVDELLKVNNEYILANTAGAKGFTHLEEMLQTLVDKGLKLAIVTGGNHKVNDILTNHEIDHFFTSVVHSERVKVSKPDPEGFLLAVQECGVLPSEAIMVGDSPTDILAGKNGKAAITIGVTHGNGSREDLEAANTDYIVDSLEELTGEILDKVAA